MSKFIKSEYCNAVSRIDNDGEETVFFYTSEQLGECIDFLNQDVNERGIIISFQKDSDKDYFLVNRLAPFKEIKND